MEYGDTVLRLTAQAFVILGVVTFIIQWLLPRWRKFIGHHTVTETRVESDEDKARNRQRQKHVTDALQNRHNEKATVYKETILIPREEAKKKLKEEEFQRFLGPAWKGQGYSLGGESNEDSDLSGDLTVGQNAARHRKSPETESVVVTSKQEKKKKEKRVIVLPEEPPESSNDSILVILRTPVGNPCQRRFWSTDSIQVIFDFMTTAGYSQSIYTLSTSYPRTSLHDQTSSSLADLGFFRKVILNVEEKEG